ncbi:MAG: transglutaminase family protein [Gammaproteobacteria bacterium]|nr:MAG: transglutaminase family protein [Gammaproteobacteria bacterium]
MRYRVTHTTHYDYTDTVTLCHNEARLTPSSEGRQQCGRYLLTVTPTPKIMRERRDYFGNRVTYFGVESPHSELIVNMVSEVITEAAPTQLQLGAERPWEEVRDALVRGDEADLRLMQHFLLDSPLVRTLPELSGYALESFTPGRGIMEAAMDLTHRIYADFSYDSTATTISTPLSQVWKDRRGVCQDFAHLAIASLRGIGLAAGYVSGYLETLPPAGAKKLVGSDASHAWLSLYVPDVGWLEFDPTNDQMPTEQYIVLARGRDYADVSPLNGVIYGGGPHTMDVSVDVLDLDAPV